MKKLLALCILSFCIGIAAYADDVDMPSTGDLWDNWGASQTYYGQDKSVSDEDFDKAIESLKDKKNKILILDFDILNNSLHTILGVNKYSKKIKNKLQKNSLQILNSNGFFY